MCAADARDLFSWLGSLPEMPGFCLLACSLVFVFRLRLRGLSKQRRQAGFGQQHRRPKHEHHESAEMLNNIGVCFCLSTESESESETTTADSAAVGRVV